MNANNWEQKQLEKLHWLISLIQLHPLGHNHDEGQAYESTNLEGSQIHYQSEPLLCHPLNKIVRSSTQYCYIHIDRCRAFV